MGIKSKSKRYNYEQKLKAVLTVVEEYRSMQSVAGKIGASKQEVRRWVALYKQFGKEGLIIKNNHYSVEFKLSAIKYMEKNKLSYFKTAVMFGIPCDSVLQKWKRKYDEQGVLCFIQKNLCRDKCVNSDETKLTEKTKEELIKELQYLQAENAYLKKLQALVQERVTRESGKKPKPSKN